ncbi:MAG TPA: AAA family ATPase, partial [Candidatus Nanopelagicales bacterium]|nr:AAA family ATPase [Candidatus Nanopelagicales bacterium]
MVAFYGFRGGAGRTTALAHVAVSLAEASRRVVVIDLDLEAPGVHTVLGVPNVQEGEGSLALLRQAMTRAPDEELPIDPHVVFRDLPMGTRVHVIPAGPLSERYLASLEELQVGAWHMLHEPAPLGRLIDNVVRDLSPDIVLLDCRTGLSGLAASAIFHVADVVVCFIPLSEQALEGLDVFLAATAAAKARRQNRPALLLVPSMVPEGPEGQARLATLVPLFEDRYLQQIGGL